MKPRSRKWMFWILLLGIVSTSIFYADTLFDRAVKKTVSLALNAINAKKMLLVSIDEVDMDAAKGSIYLKGIKLVPDSLYFEKFKNGTTAKRVLTDIRISEIELTNLSIKALFRKGRIDSANVLVKNLITTVYLKKANHDPKPISKNRGSGVLDSLYLKGVNSIDLGAIQVSDYQLNVLDADTRDTISSFSGDHLELDGVDFEKRLEGADLFELRTDKFGMTLSNQRLRLAKNEYEISLGALEFKNSEQLLKLVDFRYRPIKGPEHLASKRKYADPIFDINFKNLTVQGLDINSYRENHLGSIRKILIDGMHLSIFKNKQKPENINKRPLLPQQSLKKMNYPIHIGQIEIGNSVLTYKQVQPKDANQFLIVNLTDLNAQVNYVTSIKDSLASGRPLTVALNSKLLDKVKVDINLTMPYNHANNAFHYTGNVAPADLSMFNTLLIPAVNIAIETGKMESIHFSVDATPEHAHGELTMRYSDLHVDVHRKDRKVEHALSFLASTAVHTSNPKKNGKVRIAQVDYDRIYYKGVGDYIIKSVLSGVINTIQPLGKTKKQEKNKKSKKNGKSG